MQGAGGSSPCRVWAEPSVPLPRAAARPRNISTRAPKVQCVRPHQHSPRLFSHPIHAGCRGIIPLPGLGRAQRTSPTRRSAPKKTQAQQRQRRVLCAHISTHESLMHQPNAFPSAEGAVGEGGSRRLTDEGLVLPIGKNLGAVGCAAKGGVPGSSNCPNVGGELAPLDAQLSPRC